MNGDVLSIAALCLLAWLVLVQTTVLRQQKETDSTCRFLQQQAYALSEELRRAEKAYLADWHTAVRQTATRLERVAALRDDIDGLYQQLVHLPALPPLDGGAETQVNAVGENVPTHGSAPKAGPTHARKTELMEAGEMLWTDGTTPVGALLDVVSDPATAKQHASSLQQTLRPQLFGMYSTFYRFALFRETIAAWRELMQPYIEAVEKRYDRMLYNYI